MLHAAQTYIWTDVSHSGLTGLTHWRQALFFGALHRVSQHYFRITSFPLDHQRNTKALDSFLKMTETSSVSQQLDIVDKPLSIVIEDYMSMARNNEAYALFIDSVDSMVGKDEFGNCTSVEDCIMMLICKEVKYVRLKRRTIKFTQWLDENDLSDQEYRLHSMQCECHQRLLNEYEKEPVNYGRVLQLTMIMDQHGPIPKEVRDAEDIETEEEREERIRFIMQLELEDGDMPSTP
jgi:hypothetical protein